MSRRALQSAPTLSDVAREAGVSLATASRAINGSSTRTVRDDLARRVREAAEALGYAPNANAQAMARGATQTIGVVVHDLTDPYFGAIADGLATAARRHQIFMTLATTGNNIDALSEIVSSLDSMRVRAIILVGARWKDNDLADTLGDAAERYLNRGGRLVTLGMEFPGVDGVRVDNHGGAIQLADRLVELGYRKPLVLLGGEGHSTAMARSSAFVARMAEHGIMIDESHQIASDLTRAGGEVAMQLALESRAGFDVIVTMSDVMALGALRVARRHGLRVPESTGLTGFGDISSLQDITPSLTTVRVPTEQMASLALNLAMNGPGDGSGSVTVPATPVVRDSTPPRPTEAPSA